MPANPVKVQKSPHGKTWAVIDTTTDKVVALRQTRSEARQAAQEWAVDSNRRADTLTAPDAPDASGAPQGASDSQWEDLGTRPQRIPLGVWAKLTADERATVLAGGTVATANVAPGVSAPPAPEPTPAPVVEEPAAPPTTPPVAPEPKETVMPALVKFQMPGKVFNVLTGVEQLKEFQPKLAKSVAALFEKAERVEGGKGFKVKFAVTAKQADAINDAITDALSRLGKVKGRGIHENNTITYLKATQARINEAVDAAIDASQAA